MSIFLLVIGWIVFVLLTSLAIFIGYVIGVPHKDDVELVSLFYMLAGLAVAVVTKILFIDSIWIATGIWIVVGSVVGYLIGRYSSKKSGSSTKADRPAVTVVHRAEVKSLLETCPQVQVWMRDDPSPAMKRIREIGEELNARGGKRLMQEVHAEFVKSGGAQWGRHIEMMWSGIGTWRG